MRRKNIFVMALDPFNLELLRTIRGAPDYRFYSLLEHADLIRQERYDMPQLLEKARRQLRSFPDPVDAIVAYWDFPAGTMTPILRREFGLPTPPLEAVLKCEHKYWSRREQLRAVPELVPRFCVFDPFAADPERQVDLDYPFWVKPVKAHSSFLGFRVENRGEFRAVLEVIRRRISRVAEPFNHLLGFADLPAEIADVDGYRCLAEEIIDAERQCTLEGYDWDGTVEIYGVVDSLREAGGSSFTRYQYPSCLPAGLQRRMAEAARRVMTRIELRNAPFNIEFFHDPQSDRLSLLQVNPRISKSHCPLFAMVDGASHMEVMVDLALGRRPDFPRGQGPFATAAKFMLRRFAEARVVRIPEASDIRRVQQELPGTLVQLYVHAGERLSAMQDQDSYSFEYGVLFVGGRSPQDLEARHRRCLELLPFEFAP